MSQIKKIYTGYHPRPWQDYVHKNFKRFNVLLLHRRAGKTVWAVNQLIHSGLTCPNRNPLYAYIAPTFSAAKRICWEMLKDFTKHIPNVTSNEQELRLDIYRPQFADKVRIQLLGAEQPDSLRGLGLDGAILDEMASMNPIIWSQIIRPAIADRKGFVAFVSTPKGPGAFKDLYDYGLTNKDWFVYSLKASESGILPKEELDLARATMSDCEFEQEFEISFNSPNSGSYFGKLLQEAQEQNRITNVPYDKALPVYVSFDIGIGDSTSLWFMQADRQSYRFIDCYENSGHDLEHYVKILKQKKYNYEEFIFPHDVKARDLSSGVTREQTLRSLGLKPIRVLERSKIEDRINAARLAIPKAYFDQTNCEKGLKALWAYEAQWDNKRQVFSDKPLHNWASNFADSFTYMAMANIDSTRKMRLADLPRKADDMHWDPFNLASGGIH